MIAVVFRLQLLSRGMLRQDVLTYDLSQGYADEHGARICRGWLSKAVV